MREKEIELNPVQSLINPTVDRRCFSPGRRSKRLHFLINSPSHSQLVRSERGAQPEVICLSLAYSRDREEERKVRERDARRREKNSWLEFASSDLKTGIIFFSRSSALHLSLFLACHCISSAFYRILRVATILSAISITCLNRMAIDSAAMHARSPVAFVHKDINKTGQLRLRSFENLASWFAINIRNKLHYQNAKGSSKHKLLRLFMLRKI